MKILVNTSTLVGSGVTQVAVSFLYECLKLDNRNEYHVFLGKKVSEAIHKEDFDKRFCFYDFPIKPVSIFKGGLRSVFQMKKIEKKLNPDVTFTIFGPSYWTPNSPHLQGYAYPHYVYKESPFFEKINVKERLKIRLLEFIHLKFLKRNGHYFVSETQDVSERFKILVNRINDQFYTASNTCNSFFVDFVKKDDNHYFDKDTSYFYFASLCTLQTHKNLTILNKVIPLLVDQGEINMRFVLTISEGEVNKVFDKDVRDFIIPVGRINPDECPLLLSTCDALFLPTLLECFTANYPEAMALRKPIMTSNLSFATKLCGEAALYFDPLDEKDIANKISVFMHNTSLQNALIVEGDKVLNTFLSATERALKYLEILKSLRYVK